MKSIKIIGDTPMIRINYEFNNSPKYIYAKLEYYNLTGSIKDRVAFYIIKKPPTNHIVRQEFFCHLIQSK